MDASPDSIAMIDLEGRFIKVSKRTLDMHGFDSEDELIGRDVLSMIAPSQRAMASRTLEETLAYGTGENLEYELLRKDGTSFEGEMNASRITDEYGRAYAFITAVRDVTRKNRRERVIQRLSKQVIAEYERARTKIGDDIHDSVGQSLLTLKMELEMLRESALGEMSEDTREKFVEAMDDDFNSAGALAVLFDLVREINQARANGATNAELKSAQDLLCELAAVLGLTMKEAITGDQTAKPFIDLLVELRLELRKQKQYALGDMVRQRLTALGVILEDSKEGTTWRWG